MVSQAAGSSAVLLISEDAIAKYLQPLINQIAALSEIVKGITLVDPDPLLSEEEVAGRLGRCVRTMRNRLKNREMEYIEIRGKRFVYSSEFNRYIKSHCIPRKKSYMPTP